VSIDKFREEGKMPIEMKGLRNQKLVRMVPGRPLSKHSMQSNCNPTFGKRSFYGCAVTLSCQWESKSRSSILHSLNRKIRWWVQTSSPTWRFESIPQRQNNDIWKMTNQNFRETKILNPVPWEHISLLFSSFFFLFGSRSLFMSYLPFPLSPCVLVVFLVNWLVE